MQISILSEKMKALKNFIFHGCKEKRMMFFLGGFFPNIHGKIFFRKGFFAKLQNVILQRPLAVQMKSSE